MEHKLNCDTGAAGHLVRHAPRPAAAPPPVQFSSVQFKVQFSLVQFKSWCSWVFGLNFISFFDHHVQSSVQSSVHLMFTFLSSVQFSSVQFSSVQLFLRSLHSKFSSVLYTLRFDIIVTATHDARGHLAWTFFGHYFLSSIIMFKVQFNSKFKVL